MRDNLREALIHEHSHYEVARHLGLEVRGIRIARNMSGDETENPWLGMMSTYTTEDENRLRLVGLAGVVAEGFADRGDVYYMAPMMWHVIKTGESSFSAEDAQMAGEFNMDHLQEAVDLVRTLWADIEAGANAHQLRIESKDAVFSVWHPNGYTGFDATEYEAFIRQDDADGTAAAP